MLSKKQMDNISKANSVVFSTCYYKQPRSINVVPSKITKDQIIISNIQMDKSFENIKRNHKCFVLCYLPDKEDLQYKIDGVAKIYKTGKLFNEIKKYEEENNLPPELKVSAIIVINIKNIEESIG